MRQETKDDMQKRNEPGVEGVMKNDEPTFAATLKHTAEIEGLDGLARHLYDDVVSTLAARDFQQYPILKSQYNALRRRIDELRTTPEGRRPVSALSSHERLTWEYKKSVYDKLQDLKVQYDNWEGQRAAGTINSIDDTMNETERAPDKPPVSSPEQGTMKEYSIAQCEAIVREADTLIESKQYAEAKEKLAPVIGYLIGQEVKGETTVRAINKLAKIYVRQHDWAAAKEVYELSYQVQPNTKARTQLQEIYKLV